MIREVCLAYADLETAQSKELNQIQITPKDKIIDEDKSVKWNREEVERRIQEAQQKRADLRKKHIQARSELQSKIYSTIQAYCEVPITIAAAKVMYEYACQESDSYGMDEVSDTLYDLIDLVEQMFKNAEITYKE